MQTVRFGIIGLGNMGSHHVTYINDVEGASLGAICDIDKPKLDKFAAQYKVPAFERYQDMLDSKAVDAILIAVPHYFHPEMAMAAFKRNIHVLSEKPIAVTVGAARQLNEDYKKYPHLKFGVMFQTRTVALYRKLRELIAEGELGELTRITWTATDWFRTWSYYASGGWRATWAGEGGGVLLNQCPHNLDLLYWVTGLMPKRITAVAHIAKTHPIEVEDEVSAIMEYANGATGHFITTTGETPGTNRLEICGDRGKIVAEHNKLHFTRLRKSAQETNRTSPESFAWPERWEFEVPFNTRAPEGHKVITQNFTRAILKDEPLMSPGTDGVKGLEIGNAMLLSGLTRKPVDLPMDADVYEKFLKELIKNYGGKKSLQTRDAQVDMGASFH